MKKILIISTGGTFNKRYNPLTGYLDIDRESKSIQNIATKWKCDLIHINIIGKDSLNMNKSDRLKLLHTIKESSHDYILIIHGTDTMDVTAAYLDNENLNKCIVLTGAMIPYSIDTIEATANLASAYGYLQGVKKNAVYISMNGIIDTHDRVKKDREHGLFYIYK